MQLKSTALTSRRTAKCERALLSATRAERLKMKYKVGDKVRVRQWEDMEKEFGLDSAGDIKTHHPFVSPMRKYCGKEFIIKEVYNNSYRLEGCGVWNFTDETIVPVCNKKIVITTDGKTTLARLYEGGKVTKASKAQCSPDDEFDFITGAKLAFERISQHEKEQEHKEKKLYSGKVVCVEKYYSDAAYTVGKIYEFRDGKVKIDNGHKIGSLQGIYTLDDWNKGYGILFYAKFIELKE